MAAADKYIDLNDDYSEDIVLFFRRYLEQIGLAQSIKFKVIGDHTQKKIIDFKINTPLNKFMTGLDLVIVVNHTVFEYLEGRDKLIIIDNFLCGLYFDFKKEVLKNNTGKKYGDLVTKKYGIDTLININSTIDSIYEQQKN